MVPASLFPDHVLALAPVAAHHKAHGSQALVVTAAEATALMQAGVVDTLGAVPGTCKRSGVAIYRGELVCTHGIPLAGYVWGIEILVDDGTTPIVVQDAPPADGAPLFTAAADALRSVHAADTAAAVAHFGGRIEPAANLGDLPPAPVPWSARAALDRLARGVEDLRTQALADAAATPRTSSDLLDQILGELSEVRALIAEQAEEIELLRNADDAPVINGSPVIIESTNLGDARDPASVAAALLKIAGGAMSNYAAALDFIREARAWSMLS
jgi:hypothetical protein